MVGGGPEGAPSLSELWARFCRFRGLLLFPCECGRRENMLVQFEDVAWKEKGKEAASCSKSRAVDKVWDAPKRSAMSGGWCADDRFRLNVARDKSGRVGFGAFSCSS